MKQPTTNQIIIEQANGDSFAKRINGICRYYAQHNAMSSDEKVKAVRESVLRAFDNAEIVVYHTTETGLRSILANG